MDIPQPWIFVGRTDTETEAPVFCSSDANRRLIGKISHAGKDWGQKEKRASEDEMTRWYHWCSEQKLGQTRGDGEGQGDLTCCSPWGFKDLDTTERLNNNNQFRDTHIPAISKDMEGYTWFSWGLAEKGGGCWIYRPDKVEIDGLRS